MFKTGGLPRPGRTPELKLGFSAHLPGSTSPGDSLVRLDDVTETPGSIVDRVDPTPTAQSFNRQYFLSIFWQYFGDRNWITLFGACHEAQEALWCATAARHRSHATRMPGSSTTSWKTSLRRFYENEPFCKNECASNRYARICRPGGFCRVSRVHSTLRAPDPKLSPDCFLGHFWVLALNFDIFELNFYYY
jgi:hypothetical protein